MFYVSLANKAYPTFDEELKTAPIMIPLGTCCVYKGGLSFLGSLPGDGVGSFKVEVFLDIIIMTVKARLAAAVRKTITRSNVIRYIMRRNKSICC